MHVNSESVLTNRSAARDKDLWTLSDGDRSRTLFAVDGMRCASCARAVERAVGKIRGVERVQVNVGTARASVEWRSTDTNLPEILHAVRAAGFDPVPLSGQAADEQYRDARRKALKRIGLAGLGSMQVMMYVFALYAAEPGEMEPGIASFLRFVGLFITVPVLLYSGEPFFRSAWQSIRKRTLSMDVPVALALALAFTASAVNTFRGAGETYFDSVTMFIFFLSTGRFIEMSVRRGSLTASEALGRSLPATVLRLKNDGTTERIPVRTIKAGDRLSIPKGAVVPVDALLAIGHAQIDESLITGESNPARREAGERLMGGGVNAGNVIEVIAQQTVENSTLASIVALVERAQLSRPRLTRAADHMASWFVGTVLIIALLVAAAWLWIDPRHAFSAALAVLVVTCPCALSLATPAAAAAAATRLARKGILVTRPDALERLSRVDTVVLDKTGTLTTGEVSIDAVEAFGPYTREFACSIAAALERGSEHPIARMFAAHSDGKWVATDIQEIPGHGIEGTIDGERWRLGRFGFVAALSQTSGEAEQHGNLFLGHVGHMAATFRINHEIRPGALTAVLDMQAQGLEVIIASGDSVPMVMHTAHELGIGSFMGRLDPEQKLNFVKQLQSEGRNVLMIGDGVNDGPVLAAADVSCAMGQGSAVAHAAADLLLLNESFAAISESVRAAKRMIQIIRQNLGWALAYNLSTVPLAALDLLPPWVAALGMSLSSLLVVLNASRLARSKPFLTLPAARTSLDKALA